MDHEQDRRPPLELQTQFWNKWNRTWRESDVGTDARQRGKAVIDLLASCQLDGPKILDLGCGSGWLTAQLAEFGPATGIDLADDSIRKAQNRAPHIEFLAGDFLTMELPQKCREFDVIVCLETVAHVPDQNALVTRISSLLKPGGHLIMTTQNKPVMALSDVQPLAPGQIRNWVDMKELVQLLSRWFDVLRKRTIIPPKGRRGYLGIVNSYTLNRLLIAAFSRRTIDAIKLRAGLGQSIVVLAQKRS